MTTSVDSPAVQSPRIRAWLLAAARGRLRPATYRCDKKSGDVRDEDAYRRKKDGLIRLLGGWTSDAIGAWTKPITLPYTHHVAFPGDKLDIDHVVPLREALDSGACAWSRPQWHIFQGDLANLMLATPKVNRVYKGAKGVAEWVPPEHAVWYCVDAMQIKLAYELTFSPAEIVRLENVLGLI